MAAPDAIYPRTPEQDKRMAEIFDREFFAHDRARHAPSIPVMPARREPGAKP